MNARTLPCGDDVVAEQLAESGIRILMRNVPSACVFRNRHSTFRPLTAKSVGRAPVTSTSTPSEIIAPANGSPADPVSLTVARCDSPRGMSMRDKAATITTATRMYFAFLFTVLFSQHGVPTTMITDRRRGRALAADRDSQKTGGVELQSLARVCVHRLALSLRFHSGTTLKRRAHQTRTLQCDR